MDADHAVDGHDRIRFEQEILTVTFLRLVWIVKHVILVEGQLSILCDVLGFKISGVFSFQEIDVFKRDLESLSLFSEQHAALLLHFSFLSLCSLSQFNLVNFFR